MSRKNHEFTYNPQEKIAIATEFSPALAEVLETITPAWGNNVVVESDNQQEPSPSTLLKLRQLGDKGLLAAMNYLKGDKLAD